MSTELLVLNITEAGTLAPVSREDLVKVIQVQRQTIAELKEKLDNKPTAPFSAVWDPRPAQTPASPEKPFVSRNGGPRGKASRLRKAIIDSGITQRQLATALEFSPMRVSRACRGHMVSFDTAQAIAKHFNTTPSKLGIKKARKVVSHA